MDKSEVTKLLIDFRKKEDGAYDQLFPLVYDELKQLAYSKLKIEDEDVTYSETELVHEVYIRLIDQTLVEPEDKNHFMGIAARCMRQILVDHARKKHAQKRGGGKQDKTYIDELFKVHRETEQVIDLDDKLTKLAEYNERMANVVTLRFFGQMTVYDTAKALGISERTVKRAWAKARGWLYKEME